MPRNRSAGRPAPSWPTAPARAASAPQQRRPASTVAAPPAKQHAPQQMATPGAAQSQGSGLFGQMASTAAYVPPLPLSRPLFPPPPLLPLRDACLRAPPPPFGRVRGAAPSLTDPSPRPVSDASVSARSAHQADPPPSFPHPPLSGVAIGSSVGHAIGGFFSAGASEPAPQPAAQSQAQNAQQQEYSGNCQSAALQFNKCMDEQRGDMQICNWYLEQLKACQAATRPY